MNTQRLFHYVEVLFLPLTLALLFAIQNQVFNNWLSLFSPTYSPRLLVVSFALGLILYSPALFFKKRGRYIYLFSVSFFISFIFLMQFLYFEYGQSFVQVSALRYAGQATEITGTIVSLLSWKLLFFITNILVVALALGLTFQEHYQEILLSHKEKIVLFILLLAVAFCGYYFLVRQEDKDWGDASRLYQDVYDLNTLVEKIGIFNFTLEDALKYLLRSNLVTADDKAFLASFAKSRVSVASKKKPQYFGIAKNKNIIIVQIESLENCVIGQTLGGQEITPNLNQLVNQGVYFTNYYTQVGPGNTADAEFSTLNSLYPLSDDVVFVDYAQNYYQALPADLVKNGYHTYALHGDVPTFWNRSNIYPNLGYQKQISEDDYVITRPIGKGPSPLGDEDFLMQSLPKMETFKQPFLSTLITLSSHTPFELPQDLQTLPIPQNTNLNYTQQQYLESIHYMDKALGEFMAKLQTEPFYKNSIILVYGDHESYTNICDQLNTAPQTFPALFNSQVPLLILHSGIPAEQIATPASHLDFFPTVANLVGVASPKSILGQDIFNTQTAVVTRRNIFSGSVNTILTNTLAFKANTDGVFNDGTCLSMPSQTPLPVGDCQDLYAQQSETARASDIIIRGNLLSYYLANLPK